MRVFTNFADLSNSFPRIDSQLSMRKRGRLVDEVLVGAGSASDLRSVDC